MKIHALSDLHSELDQFRHETDNADVIVLAGDIDTGCAGIRWGRLSWPDKQIIYVPGNHEYYGEDARDLRVRMAKVAAECGVHLLNPGEVVIGGVRFLGATLWTDFRLFGDETISAAMRKAARGLNDFRQIRFGHERLTPELALTFFEADSAFLKSKLEAGYDGKTVVVTHHLPTALSVSDRYKGDILSACFASNADDLIGLADLWIHGHTHDSMNYVHPSGTRIVCNPRGYFDENEEFNSTLVEEVHI